MVEVMTIGAYGWNAETFFDALVGERVGTFCDLRRRRGVRGPEYAFVNSARVQVRLREIGIAYEHRLDLAPSTAIRQKQYAEDERLGVGKRDRSQLAPAFKAAYEEECLDAFDSVGFLDDIASDQPTCLFCVERDPHACHRSLVAEKLAHAGATVRHLLP
jgi:uncharacterized protein YeaO (DUF488 family)